MASKHKSKVTDTMLITVWARAVEAQAENPILEDPNALRILQELGYGLDLYDAKKQNGSQVGCCIRARWIDDRVKEWVASNPGGQVIQLGAGVDDRFRRLGMPRGIDRWYDLDLPEVCDLRGTVISPAEGSEVIAMSLFDTAWMQRLADTRKPTLIIIEGVLMYFTEEQIRDLLGDLQDKLPGSTLLFDAVPASIVKKGKHHDTLKEFDGKVEFLWGIGKPSDMERMASGLHFERYELMFDLPWADRFVGILRLMRLMGFTRRRFSQRLLQVRVG